MFYILHRFKQDGNLVLSTVQELLSQALQHWQTMDFKDVEIAITMTYMLAEALPVSSNVLINCM